MRTARMALIPCLLVAASAAADVGYNAVGINSHLPTPDMLDAAADLGLGWIRIDVNWFQGEPRPGDYRWGHLDPIVDGATARGLKVFMSIGYTPDWATAGNRDPEHPESGNDVPRAGLYEQYVRAVVSRYRDRVQHYGLWNEPNLSSFFEGDAREYIELILRPGAAAVRDACAACQVLGPELAGVGGWQEYLAAVLSAAGDELDVLTHHTYKSFQETRAGLFVCDDLPHALDSSLDAICFFKPGLAEVMRDAGLTPGVDLEVWMTEVGDRASPVGNAAAEQRQAMYYRRVLEEQLARPWWTHTFFYELMDCECGPPGPQWGCMPEGACDIDGFGILHRIAAPDDSWSDNFRRKPAYLQLRGLIATNPRLRGAPPPACGDGADNDRDGLVDLLDPGCADVDDADEGGDPPPPVVAAPRASAPPMIDGALDEWPPDAFTELGEAQWVDQRPGHQGAADASARFALQWDAEAIYLAVDVRDERHANDHLPGELWLGDSVQLALDIGRDGGTGYDRRDDHELGFARIGDASARWRWVAPDGHGGLDVTGVVAPVDGGMRYEARLSGASLSPIDLREGAAVGFSVLVNDDDGLGREGWLEWTPGIGGVKAPGRFGELRFVGAGAAPASDAGVIDAGPPPPGTPDAGEVDDRLDGGRRAEAGAAEPSAPSSGGSDGGCMARPGAARGGLLAGVLVLCAVLVGRRRG